MKNGDQVAAKLYDGSFHKLTIIHNSHHHVDSKDKSLTFTMTNNGRDFTLNNSGCKFMDYDLIDRIIHGVSIDTERFRGLLHNLQYKQVPHNLRPTSYLRYTPFPFAPKKFNSSRFIWNLQNRTIYRYDQDSGLRNTEKPDDLGQKLSKDHSLHFMTSEDRFYKLFSISRTDFLDKLADQPVET